MKTENLFLLVLLFGLGSARAYAVEADSLRVAALDEVVVRGVRLGEDAPFTVDNISSEVLSRFEGEARELPTLFSRLPGIISWSDNGVGIGTTYLRIRGSADSRINVTLDGVPLNSPEDECVFWANMNSYAGFLGSIQVQKGVGSSTAGDGAFGGNIALAHRAIERDRSFDATVSYGMYNSFNAGANYSTGLLHDHFSVDAAYHHTFTGGYMAGTSGMSGSALVSLSWISHNMIVRYSNILNYERMGQAWNGVDTGELLDGNYGISTGLNSYKDFYRAGLGRYNNLYESLVTNPDGSYSTSRYTLRDGTFWKQTTDRFFQDHNILSLTLDVGRHMNTSLTLHYTAGHGSYEEFQPNAKLSKYGIKDFTLSDGTLLTRTDFVRQKGLGQNTFGAIYNLTYDEGAWTVVAGGAVNGFSGGHYGYINYIANEELWDYFGGKRYSYYGSGAKKWDANLFARATYKLPFDLALYGDVQYRWVYYNISGANDKFLDIGDEYMNQILLITEKYHFFNPKAGLSYTKNGHKAYASVAISHREPERNNFTDNGSYPSPTAERLTDWELGYSYNARTWYADATFYYMKYHNQFVQTGELSDIGEALTTNIKDSYRMGVELSLGVTPIKWLTLSGNLALSKNRIKDFDEVVEDWDFGSQTIHYDHSTLAFSPSFVGNLFVEIGQKGWKGTWHTALVSRQYLDNTAAKDRSLPSYSVSDLSLSYTLSLPKTSSMTFSVYLNNIFNRHYAASGWVYSAICESAGNTNENRYREIGYFPMAGTCLMTNVSYHF